MGDSFKIGDNEHTINNYELVNKTSYQYRECVNDKCNDYIKTVLPKTGDNVLVLEISNLDKLSSDFLTNSFGLQYENKKYYGNNLQFIDTHDNKIYYSVSNAIKNTGKLSVVITMRDKRYNIELNGGEHE